MASLVTRITDLTTYVGTQLKTINTGLGVPANLTTTSKQVVGAINELKTQIGSAGATLLSQLTDVTITSPVTGNMFRFNGTTGKWENADPTIYLQPRDADLDAIAALTTTAYGRAFLSLANAAGLMGLLTTGSTSAAGILALATSAQTVTGTDTALATTAAGTKAAIDARIDNTAGLTSNSTTNAPSVAATKAYADALLDANNAQVFKGGIDASTNPNYPAASAGHMYRITVAGKIGGASGPNVEVNDTLTCLVDGTASGTQATVGANWLIGQTNIDGAVVGPASSVAGSIATFNGTTGKVIQDGGMTTDTDGTMAANSNTRLATQAAIRTYVAAAGYSQAAIGNPDTDFVAVLTAAMA